jgi:Glycine zipper
MRSIIAAAGIVAILAGMSSQPTVAQDALGGAIFGGAAGAIIGGAATGRAGGAIAGGIIGAAVGAAIGDSMEPRRRGYYWYQDRCWLRRGDGSYVRVRPDYCD